MNEVESSTVILYQSYSHLKTRRTSTEKDPQCGRPPTLRSDLYVSSLRDLVYTDRRIAVRELVKRVSISLGSCHEIKIFAVCVYRSTEKKHVEISQTS